MTRAHRGWSLPAVFLLLLAVHPAAADPMDGWFDNSGRADVLSGGVRMIPITTPKGSFKVWTKRVGNNPTVKVLLLHGGPGLTHEYLEAFDSWFPGAGVEYYYYDQLGSAYSDQPDDSDLWTIPRFVDEVEQVRAALGLDRNSFFLFGQSWGGLLAIEYALKYPQHLRGLIISNMMASGSAYNDYARDALMPGINPEVLAEIRTIEAAGDFANPRYMELLIPHHYEKHILRLPQSDWPEPFLRSGARLNQKVYVPLQGPSELGASGALVKWDRRDDLAQITTPTLVIGATHDTMDPKHMEWMAGQVKRGRYLHCPNGSHLAIYDDQKVYMTGILKFLEDVDEGQF